MDFTIFFADDSFIDQLNLAIPFGKRIHVSDFCVLIQNDVITVFIRNDIHVFNLNAVKIECSAFVKIKIYVILKFAALEGILVPVLRRGQTVLRIRIGGFQAVNNFFPCYRARAHRRQQKNCRGR